MYKVCSIFSQVLKLFARGEFENAVKEHQAERHARGFTSWGQFMAMLFCQLGRAHSLREICGGLACCEGQLKHLGVPVAPKRSTLAYANEHRPWQLYQAVFEQTLCKCQQLVQSQGGRKKFRFKNKLLSLDGSIIDLSVSMFDWAKYRTTKGAIKLHLLLDHDGYLPSFCVVTTGKVADVTVAQRLKLQPGTIVVDDRGYNDYELFGRWTEEGVYFVTRLKDNAVYRVVKNLPVPQTKNGGVLKDQLIRFTGVDFNILRQLFQQFMSQATLCAAIDIDGIRRTSIHHCRRYALGQPSCRWASHSRPAGADRRIRAI